MQLRLPVKEDTTTVKEWLGCKTGQRQKLETLVGLLQHAVKVAHPGHRFVQR